MIIKNTTKKHNSKLSILILIIMSIIDLTLFILIKVECFKNIDINFTNFLQNSLIKIRAGNTQIPLYLQSIEILNQMYVPYIIILIISNFGRINDVFILFNTLSASFFISTLLKLIYYSPPYDNFIHPPDNQDTPDEKFPPTLIYYCGNGWALPSTEYIIQINFYLSFWKLICGKNKNTNNNELITKIKWMIFSCFIILFILYTIGILLMGYYYMSQIVFSLFIAITIYLLFFHSFNLHETSPKEFVFFISQKARYYLIIYVSLIIVIALIYLFERFILSQKYGFSYNVCTTINMEKNFDKSGNYYCYIDGSFYYAPIFVGHIFAILGLVCEYKFLFGSNEQNFYQFHFPLDVEQLRESNASISFLNSINIIKETEWNNTSMFISIIRQFSLFLIGGVCLFPYFLIDLENYHIGIILTTNIFLPSFLFSFGLFFYFKQILKPFGLINRTLERVLEDK